MAPMDTPGIRRTRTTPGASSSIDRLGPDPRNPSGPAIVRPGDRTNRPNTRPQVRIGTVMPVHSCKRGGIHTRSEVPAYLPGQGELPLVGHKAVLFGGQPDSAGLRGFTAQTLLKCIASVKNNSATPRPERADNGRPVLISAAGGYTRSHRSWLKRPDRSANGVVTGSCSASRITDGAITGEQPPRPVRSAPYA